MCSRSSIEADDTLAVPELTLGAPGARLLLIMMLINCTVGVEEEGVSFDDNYYTIKY